MINNFVWIGVFLYLRERDDRREKSRFREFVLASKAEKLEDYAVAIPNDEPVKKEPEHEIVDLDQTDPSELLKAIHRSQNENQ